MRNLKKILALVLALVMSLSLMATASAADFKDASDISENYQTAVNVLEGLKVFKGYAEDNTFRPKGEITRAEVATIIYRIATGDAEDAQASIYTNMTTSFTDLDKAEWARGYVNYCHNAQIIKGESATKFNPNGKITGYATLAMILRAMGYGKNGEFEGTQWEYQTAAKAKEIGLIDNVIEAQLGSNAPRELVAEILFRALLTEMVDYTVLNGYVKNGKTLGQVQFGLEQITGVVMANQWAALDDDTVMAVDTTRMLVTEVTPKNGAVAEVGKTVTLDSATDLEAVGMSYVAYVAGKTSDKQTLTLAEGVNNVGFNEGKAIATNNSDQGYKALKDLGVALNDKTEYYVDYEENWENDATSDFLIRYTIDVESINNAVDRKYITADQKADWIEWLDKCVKNNTAITYKDKNGVIVTYERTIRPEQNITELDQEIMKEIFYGADRYLEFATAPGAYIKGEVFVGTATTKDVSDTMSWKQFTAEYFNDSKTVKKFTTAENGESVRTIDNNGDGVAEYALKVTYTMDKVVGTYKDALLLNTQAFANYNADKNTLVAPELEQGDVVVYSKIDKQLHVRKAEADTDTIKTHSFKDITITTEGGETYGQSGIENATGMDELIRNMNDKTEYIMYKDLFNFVRAYELAQGTKYALVTEMYANGTWNENYVVNNRLTAEVKVADEAIKEYTVANAGTTPLRSNFAWSSSYGGYSVTNLNYLQPAIAHLGYLNWDWNTSKAIDATYPGYYPGATVPTSLANVNVGTNAYQFAAWYRTVWQLKVNAGSWGVFDYGPEIYRAKTDTVTEIKDDHSASFTNVAAYTPSGDNAVTLNTASELFLDKNGEQVYYMGQPNLGKTTAKTTRSEWLTANPTLTVDDFNDRLCGTNVYGHNGSYERFYRVYKTDYVQLNMKAAGSTDVAVKANTIHYPVAADYVTKYNTFSGNNTPYVNATVDTEFYIVLPGYGVDNVQYFKGVANLPTILKGEIRAAYAVAHNTAINSSDNDYWVADVIVIETSDLFHNWESVSLMYYSPYETSASVFSVSSLNSQWRTYQPDSANRAMIEVTPDKTNVTGAWVDWSHNAWRTSAYGFYSLHQTEAVSDGNVTAKDARRITKDFNDYGIYAGYVTATNGLQTTGYINVDVTKTGTNDNAIWVGYTNNDVPVYRITTDYNNVVNTAAEISLNVVDRYNDVKPGDPIIWVYEKNTGKLAFVVDLAPQRSSSDPWTVPTWLYNAADFVTPGLYSSVKSNPTSEFGKICKDELTGPVAKDQYTVTFKAVGLPADLPANTLPAAFTNIYKVFSGNTLSVALADFQNANLTTAGYTAPATGGTDFAINPAATGTATLDQTSDPILVKNVDEDLTIEVKYTPAAKDIQLSAAVPANGVTSVLATYTKTDLTAATDVALANSALVNKAAVGQKVSLKINLAAALPIDGTKKVEVTVIGDTTGTKYKISAPVLVEPARNVATCEFQMPNEDVKVTAKVVDTNPDITVTTSLGGSPVLTYSVDTAPATTGAVTDAGTIVTKAGKTITFTSDANFFARVGSTGYVTPATKTADGKYTYTYLVGNADVTLQIFKAQTVTVLNSTTNNVPLTWNADMMASGGTLSGAIDNTYTIDVPNNCGWITFSVDSTTRMELTVDTVPTSAAVNGSNGAVKWSTAIAGATTLQVTTQP